MFFRSESFNEHFTARSAGAGSKCSGGKSEWGRGNPVHSFYDAKLQTKQVSGNDMVCKSSCFMARIAEMILCRAFWVVTIIWWYGMTANRACIGLVNNSFWPAVCWLYTVCFHYLYSTWTHKTTDTETQVVHTIHHISHNWNKRLVFLF